MVRLAEWMHWGMGPLPHVGRSQKPYAGLLLHGPAVQHARLLRHGCPGGVVDAAPASLQGVSLASCIPLESNCGCMLPQCARRSRLCTNHAMSGRQHPTVAILWHHWPRPVAVVSSSSRHGAAGIPAAKTPDTVLAGTRDTAGEPPVAGAPRSARGPAHRLLRLADDLQRLAAAVRGTAGRRHGPQRRPVVAGAMDFCGARLATVAQAVLCSKQIGKSIEKCTAYTPLVS